MKTIDQLLESAQKEKEIIKVLDENLEIQERSTEEIELLTDSTASHTGYTYDSTILDGSGSFVVGYDPVSDEYSSSSISEKDLRDKIRKLEADIITLKSNISALHAVVEKMK